MQTVIKVPINLKPSGHMVRLSDAARALDIRTGTLSHWIARHLIAAEKHGPATLVDEGETKTIVALHKKYGKRAGRMLRERGYIHLSGEFAINLPPEFRVRSL